MKIYNSFFRVAFLQLCLVFGGTAIAQPGAGLDFNGINNQVDVPLSATLNITGNITLEAWVYATKNTGVQNTMCKSSLSQNTGYIFPRTNDGWANMIVYLHIGGAWRTLSAPYGSLNAWHHLAATWDGSYIRLYRDGALVATSVQYSGQITTNTNPLVIGSQPGYAEVFGGSLDECRIWNTARTQCEINTYKDCEIPGNAPGLVANYHFNQGVAGANNSGITTLIDATSNSNNGTLMNFTLNGPASNWIAPTAVVSGSVTPLAPISVSYQVSSPVVCPGTSITLNGTGANTYSWSGGVINGVAFPTNTITTYTVTGTNSLTGCAASAVATISLLASPAITITPGQQTVCSGATVSLTATGANSYTWSAGIANSVPFQINTTTSYTVTGTNSVTGCTKSAVATISVLQNPFVSFAPFQPTVCSGGTIALIGTGANSYSWTGGIVNGVPFSISSNTTYTLTGINSVTGCSNNAVATVTVMATPVVGFTPAQQNVCSGATVVLSGTGADFYSWSGGIVNAVPFPINTTSTYTVTGINSVSGCTNSAVATISVLATPVVSFAPVQPTVCSGSTITLSGTGADSYNWNGGVVNGVPFTASISSTYTVTGTNLATGCTNSAVATISVVASPVVSFAPIQKVICPGAKITLYGTGAHAYSWTGGVVNGVPFSLSSSKILVVTGTNTITGCSSDAIASLSVSSCNSLPAFSEKGNSFTFYPNPNYGEITLSVSALLPDQSIEIYDGFGKKVYQENIISEEQIIRPGLADGIYFIKLTGSDKVISVKKMISH